MAPPSGAAADAAPQAHPAHKKALRKKNDLQRGRKKGRRIQYLMGLSNRGRGTVCYIMPCMRVVVFTLSVLSISQWW